MFTIKRTCAVVLSFCILGLTPASAQTTQPGSERIRCAQWTHETLVGAYDKHGKHHPAWDEPARQALAAYATIFSDDPRWTGDEMDTIYFESRTAFQGGSKDPLLLLVAARNSNLFQRARAEWLALHIEAAHRIKETDYHPFWKCAAYLWAAHYQGQSKDDPGAQADAMRLLKAGLELAPEVLLDESIPRSARVDLLAKLGDAARVVEGTRERTMTEVFNAIEPKMRDHSLALTLFAVFLADYAWDARGSGFARRVPAENWEPFIQRLHIAAEAGAAAWEADQTNGRAAKVMMRVALGLNDDEAEALWFQRAITAEPDDYYIYLDRLLALEPKWGGSPEAMVALGRHCLEQGNFATRVPFILVDAHLAISRYAPDGYKNQPQAQYFRDVPQAWKDVKNVYDQYFQHTPEPSMFHRSRYAEIALWAGEYEEAAKQFAAMEDKFSYGWFRNDARYQRALAELRANQK